MANPKEIRNTVFERAFEDVLKLIDKHSAWLESQLPRRARTTTKLASDIPVNKILTSEWNSSPGLSYKSEPGVGANFDIIAALLIRALEKDHHVVLHRVYSKEEDNHSTPATRESSFRYWTIQLLAKALSSQSQEIFAKAANPKDFEQSWKTFAKCVPQGKVVYIILLWTGDGTLSIEQKEDIKTMLSHCHALTKRKIEDGADCSLPDFKIIFLSPNPDDVRAIDQMFEALSPHSTGDPN
ncbi:hypothetical protein BDV96DRAFT_654434 [Lophiotrema nucula]|uniref:Uncharacterized protein n=1 Tax=Lophiotrema nucula TaxID=690887 RepID=A0A6A5YI44_9PLEO|nr:hypothetical protein BDV96DRAFT_654434 [Lophiotrema nucula]